MAEPTKRRSQSSSATVQGGRDWSKLPDDVTALILLLANLDAFEILHTYQMVCKTWHKVFCDYPSLWHTVNTTRFDYKHHSAGLLKYMTDRCNGIRRLRLSYWDHNLDKLASRFPLLEELDITFERHLLSPGTLKLIGESCPLLKSLNLNTAEAYRRFQFNRSDDGYAKATAGTMPGLQHLTIDDLDLTDHALKEILDHCPHLESLNLSNIRMPRDARSWILEKEFEKENEGKDQKFAAAQ